MSDRDLPPLELATQHHTTRRRYELMRINEVATVMTSLFEEIDECLAIVEENGILPDGEMDITIIVKQRTKTNG